MTKDPNTSATSLDLSKPAREYSNSSENCNSRHPVLPPLPFVASLGQESTLAHRLSISKSFALSYGHESTISLIPSESESSLSETPDVAVAGVVVPWFTPGLEEAVPNIPDATVPLSLILEDDSELPDIGDEVVGAVVCAAAPVDSRYVVTHVAWIAVVLVTCGNEPLSEAHILVILSAMTCRVAVDEFNNVTVVTDGSDTASSEVATDSSMVCRALIILVGSTDESGGTVEGTAVVGRECTVVLCIVVWNV